MKKLYWRPKKLSARMMLLLALLSVAGLFSVERFRVREPQRFYREKLLAAKQTLQAYQVIKAERLKRGIPLDPVETNIDPVRSGLIGTLITPTTTNTGHLPAKHTSINPNWAAVFIHLLKRAGVNEGDIVAIGQSGSFPALNTACLIAIQILKLKPIIISSVGASQWGANYPNFMWTDWENILYRRGIINNRSVAVSLGGIEDQALGLTKKGQQLLNEAIERNKYTRLYVDNFRDSLTKRMVLYQQYSGGGDIKAYINVGGGTTSVGTSVGKHLFRPGLNLHMPRNAGDIDSVMTRFMRNGVPVIHITQINKLATRYGLPLGPKAMPPVGEGKIFVREGYSLWLASAVFLCILALMFAFLRLDLAFRLFAPKSQDKGSSSPEQMV